MLFLAPTTIMTSSLRSRAVLFAQRYNNNRETQCRTYNISSFSRLHSTPPQSRNNRRTVATAANPATLNPDSSSTSQNDSPNPSPISLSDQIRLLMRRVPYPVAIITSIDPHSLKQHPKAGAGAGAEDNKGPLENSFRGMTVSSFNTVTLHPEPVISFNVRRPSETLAALLTSQRFLVHLLSPTETAAALARDFSKGNQNLGLVGGKFEYIPVPSSLGIPNSSDSQRRRASSLPLPMLRERKAATMPTSSASKEEEFAERESKNHEENEGGGVGAEQKEFSPFILECQLLPQRVDVYDHTIIVGRVIRALSIHLTHPCPEELENGATVARDLCLTYANTRFWRMGGEIS